MDSKKNNDKKAHLSEDELLSHSVMYQIVFLLRTIAAQCHMLVPKQLDDVIKRWVGHGLCEVTALPSKLTCPVTGKTFLNKEVYTAYFKKNKKEIRKIKKQNNGKKPAPPTDLPKFPGTDWPAFLEADNHHKDVINEVRRARIESTIWHFSIGALKRVDIEVRPQHCAMNALFTGQDPFKVAGRNLREVICHGTKYDDLMALIAWYAIGETSRHNKWCTGLQQKPTVREIRACSIGDTEYNNPVETKPWPEKGNMWGQCHINALRLLLSEGKGAVCVGYHALRVPCLHFATILLEAHVVYYDGKTYWDATNDGGENMVSDNSMFIPLVMIDKDGVQTNANNRYRTKHSFVKCQIMQSYDDQIPMAREVVRLNTKLQEYDGTTDNNMMMKICEDRDAMNKSLQYELQFFYKAMTQFDDVEDIRYMCRNMCDRSPWLTNPHLIDSTPGMRGIPGLHPIALLDVEVRPSPVHGKGLFCIRECASGKVLFKETSNDGMLISAPGRISISELGGDQSNCSFVWGLIVGGCVNHHWIAKLCLNHRILDYMTAKDHELFDYVVELQTEGRSPEDVQRFRNALRNCFNQLESNYFRVEVPGVMAPFNVLSYVGHLCSKINHSDEPNCRMRSVFEGTKLVRVEAVALRDIVPGEELFIDYGDDYKLKLFTDEVEVKEDNNHVSSGRSGDDHKRQELEQTSEATGNNQIEFAAIVRFHLRETDSYNVADLALELTKKLKRELSAKELKIINLVLMCDKRLGNCKTDEEREAVYDLFNGRIDELSKKRPAEVSAGDEQFFSTKKKKVDKKFPLMHRKKLNVENAEKLITLMHVWSRIQGMPHKSESLVLCSKRCEMINVMGMSEEQETRCEGLADITFDRVRSGADMMVFLEAHDLLPRLKTYYKTYMKISDGALQKIMETYKKNFMYRCAYETAVDILRQEIAQDFCCENEKKEFQEKIAELNTVDPDWRDVPREDWRVKSDMENKKSSQS